MADRAGTRDQPWLFRTYAGHSSAEASNALFRENLARGQTGLSIAFDLPTQTGYDPDHPLAAGEVGKVGVPVAHLGDMERLLEGIPPERMNTSMTINATAPWLLALYIAAAERRGVPRSALSGTTQNDILKEYLSRGTYIFPPAPSLRLTADVIAFTCREVPKWNPVNICSYHLQEAGATPVEELAFALANAIAVLDAVKESGAVAPAEFPAVVGRISFFVNAGMKLVTEICKLRAFALLWDEIAEGRYGVAEERFRRFRYGVQVNSLGLTEQQPENNVYRILIEMLAVVLSKRARARAVQLPAWNEALGLPRPWDQQWSLRIQQVLAYETDLLEYGDLFDGNPVVDAKVEAL
ncbi:MAG TPA: methylmalonyl-CoA mutase family protein, partial [Methylomirabilota bacterium]|nr:methylmalonyl-CoA mutase family protein [Methylomirabilota bacterium]